MLFQSSGAPVHVGDLDSVQGEFLFEVAATLPFVFDGRFMAGDAFAIAADPGFGGADFVVDLAATCFRLRQKRFGGFGVGDRSVAALAESRNLLLELAQFSRQTTPIDEAHLRSQFLHRLVCSR